MATTKSGRLRAGRPTAIEGRDSPAVSYLVRFWLEPRERAGESSPFRGYARDLETGEERYFGDPRRFAEHVLRRLRAERQEQELWEAQSAAGREAG